MKRLAFTLIELLVVIAIIAIIAAILFPVFNRAKAQAKKTSDLSNFRQLVAAAQIYMGDNDDMAPFVDHENNYNWPTPMLAYLKSKSALQTKAYERRPVPLEEGRSIMPETDYTMNGLFSHGLPSTACPKPSTQILFALRNIDRIESDYHPWPGLAYSEPATPDWNDLSKYVGVDHTGGSARDWFQELIQLKPWNKGSNFAYLDGHTQFKPWNLSILTPLPGDHQAVEGEYERRAMALRR